MEEGRQGAERLQPGEHRLQLRARAGFRRLRIQHADLLPDEAAGRSVSRQDRHQPSETRMTFVPRLKTFAMAAAITSMAGGAFAQKGETVKLAWIDPLSGPMAPVGQNQLKSFQFMVEHFNKNNAAGVRFELVPMDNKLSPMETQSALKSAIDSGVRYVLQ